MLRYLETFFRNRWLICIPALLLLGSGALMAVMLPPTYEAQAAIWAETSAYLDLGTAPDSRLRTPAELQSGRFSELIHTNTFSRVIADRSPLGVTGTEDEKEELAEQIQQGLWVYATGDYALRIIFKYPDPDIATSVVQIAIDEYYNVTAASAQLQASQAIEFYRERIRQYESDILPGSSGALAEYLKKHPRARVAQDPLASTDGTLALLAQQAERDRQQYEQYKERLDEVMSQSQAIDRYRKVAFRVIDPPALAKASDGSHSMKELLLFAGTSVGLSVGYMVLFIVLATELDRTTRNGGDIQRRLRLPLLEVIPDYSTDSHTGRFKRAKRKQGTLMGRLSSLKPSS